MIEDDRRLLILDLDETLIHAVEAPLGRPADFQVGPYFAYRRPHLKEFLAWAVEFFEVGVWTSASPDYARIVVDSIFPDHVKSRLRFVWSCDRCVRWFNPDTGDHEWLKDLRKVKRLGWPLDRVVMVDDSPEKLRRNYSNLVRVLPFWGHDDDIELRRLPRFLEWLRAHPDVRLPEKRGWQYFDWVRGEAMPNDRACDLLIT